MHTGQSTDGIKKAGIVEDPGFPKVLVRLNQHDYFIVQHFHQTAMNLKALCLLFLFHNNSAFAEVGNHGRVAVQNLETAFDARKRQYIRFALKQGFVWSENFNIHGD
jgi:hypothetical protein